MYCRAVLCRGVAVVCGLFPYERVEKGRRNIVSSKIHFIREDFNMLRWQWLELFNTHTHTPFSTFPQGVRTAKTGSRATKHDPRAEQEKEKEEAKKKAEKKQARIDAAKAAGAVI